LGSDPMFSRRICGLGGHERSGVGQGNADPIQPLGGDGVHRAQEWYFGPVVEYFEPRRVSNEDGLPE